MSEWTSRPRQTPFAGHRKPTSTWCQACLRLHRTHRHADGEEPCPIAAPRAERGTTPIPSLIRVAQDPATISPFRPDRRR